MMLLALLLGSCFICHSGRPDVSPQSQYQDERNSLLQHLYYDRFDAVERSQLVAYERAFNVKLMEMKRSELQRLESEKSRAIQRPFSQLQDMMMKGSLYSMLLEMPKGAVLHLHWDSIVSTEWLVKNVTYEPHCWMYTGPGSRHGAMTFAAKSPGPDYNLVSELRAAAPNGTAAFDEELLRSLTSIPSEFHPERDPWKHFQYYFTASHGLLRYAPVLEKYLRKAFNDLVVRDNLIHVELRGFDVVDDHIYDLDGRIYSLTESTALLQRVALEFSGRLTVRLISTVYKPAVPPSKIGPALLSAADLRAKFPDLVVGFDLVGEEDVSPPLQLYADALVDARDKQSLTYYLHAGETAHGSNGSAADNVIDATLLAKRIGHAVALPKRPALVATLLERDVALEINPISNQVLGYVQDIQNHPATWMLEQGLSITLSPDDPAVLGYESVAADWWFAFLAWDLDLASLKKLARNSLQHCALGAEAKTEAISRWEKQWKEFVLSQSRHLVV